VTVQPLQFQPIFKRIRWGGRRLGTVLGKPIGPGTDYAESWEIADHGQDQSIVAGGPYDGQSLCWLVHRQNLPLLGRAAGQMQFPLLIKYLDACDVLSVQVHPDDRRVREFTPDGNGKTEAWVILDAAPDSRLYVGFRDGVSEADVRSALAAGRIEALLHTIEARAGECIFVPAGTVHAIGAGVLLAEVQQSSDVTFRLYDWDRLDPDGRPRPLHIEQALRSIDFERGPVDPIVPRSLPVDHSLEELVCGEHFVIHRHRAHSPFSIPTDDTCHVLLVLGGAAALTAGPHQVELPLGQTVLLPAERDPVSIHPNAEVTLLDTFLPDPRA
jgi:mannose-6-phosphate isomerase